MPQMPEPDARTAPISTRVEGWTRYYEYFHKLGTDMQVSPVQR